MSWNGFAMLAMFGRTLRVALERRSHCRGSRWTMMTKLDFIYLAASNNKIASRNDSALWNVGQNVDIEHSFIVAKK